MSTPLIRTRVIRLDYRASRELFFAPDIPQAYKLLAGSGSFIRLATPSDDELGYEVTVDTWDAARQEAVRHCAEFVAVLHRQHVLFKQVGPNGGDIWRKAIIAHDKDFLRDFDGILQSQFEPRSSDEKPRRKREGPRKQPSGAEKRRRKRAQLRTVAGVE